MRPILLTLPLIALTGCVQPAMMPAPVPAPAAPAAPSPYTPAAPTPVAVPPVTTPAPAPTPAPVPAAPSGPLDSRTGLHQSAVVAVTGDAVRGFTVLLRPDATQPARISAAPGKLCGPAGVASSATNSARSGSAMPGVQVMVVKCGGAT